MVSIAVLERFLTRGFEKREKYASRQCAKMSPMESNRISCGRVVKSSLSRMVVSGTSVGDEYGVFLPSVESITATPFASDPVAGVVGIAMNVEVRE